MARLRQKQQPLEFLRLQVFVPAQRLVGEPERGGEGGVEDGAHGDGFTRGGSRNG